MSEPALLRGAKPLDLEPRGARDGAESEGASSSHVGIADLPPPNGQEELGQWRAVDVALDGTPSFAKPEFWDRDACWRPSQPAGRSRRRSLSSSPTMLV